MDVVNIYSCVADLRMWHVAVDGGRAARGRRARGPAVERAIWRETPRVSGFAAKYWILLLRVFLRLRQLTYNT